MKIIDRHQLIDQLNWRYATKQYDATRKIPAQDWAALEEALVLTPSSIGLQPWTFLVVDNPKVRAELLLASHGQPQVVDASHLVVFATKTNYGEADVDAYIQQIVKVRKVTPESLEGLRAMALRSVVQGMNETERRHWAANQTYIALGNLVTSAALLGIDAAPMEGFEKNRYDEILGLESRGLTASVIATLGYRNASRQIRDPAQGAPAARNRGAARVTRRSGAQGTSIRRQVPGTWPLSALSRPRRAQSSRSASIGDTREARCDGRNVAASTTSAMTRAAPARTPTWTTPRP